MEVEITRGLFDSEPEEEENKILYLQIKVIDTGVGIKKDQLDKLFKSFGYIDDGLMLNNKGIGLGLNIS